MKIVSNEKNPAVLKLLVAARLSGHDIPLDVVKVSEKRTSSYSSLPLLELDSGVHLSSVNQAARFLFPPSKCLETQADQWIEWDVSLLLPAVVASVSSPGKNDTNLQSFLQTLDATLSGREFLLEGGLSVADVCIWSTLFPVAFDSKLSSSWMSNHKNLLEWWLRLQKNEAFNESIKKSSAGCGVVGLQAMSSVSWYDLGAQSASLIAKDMDDKKKKPLADTRKATVSLENELNQLQISTGAAVEGPEWEKEVETAKEAWERGFKNKLKSHTKPILPVAGERNVLVTSALPYVNNVPHLGNIIGCVLSADVFARYCRLRNYNTLYISGTDEYGTATETKALEEGLTPKEICDKYFSIHKEIYEWFNIDFDLFGRTTIPEQTEITQNLFLRLHKLGYMFTESVEQLLCQKCDRYLADRFVEGTCPKCAYEDARGDQCDGCGTLINTTELIKPRCKLCGDTPVIRNSDQFFIDFPKIELKLSKWFEERCSQWSHNARVITKSWLKEGLRPRCITRDLKWGIPVPLEQYSKKVFYVWFDAPIGYMSMTKKYTNKWLEWWQPKENIHVDYFQFMAKDNVPFHGIMFPSTLLAADDGYTTVSHIMATEYLNYEDGKFSKSRGIGVFGNNAKETGIPADYWRFYLLFVRPESQDSSFCWDDLAARINSELLNNLGNFVNRALMFVEKNFNSTIPEILLEGDDLVLLAMVNRELAAYVKNLEMAKLRDGLRHVLSISRHGNQYIQAQQPWVKAKGSVEDKKRAGTVVGVAANIACLLSVLLHPYMPAISKVMQEQMQVPQEVNVITEVAVELLKPGHKIGKPYPLVTKIEQSQVDELKGLFAGKQTSPPPAGVPKTTTGNSILTSDTITKLQQAVDKQASLVREMKASGKPKAEWQPHVSTLLQLKSDLASAQKLALSTSSDVTSLSPSSSENSQNVSDLEKAIKKQGDLVRELKANKKSKEEIQQEVGKLLELKKKLSALQPTPPVSISGVPVDTVPSSSTKKNKKKK